MADELSFNQVYSCYIQHTVLEFVAWLFRRLLAAQVEARRKEAEEQAMSLRATLGARGKQANGGIKPNKTAAVCHNVSFKYYLLAMHTTLLSNNNKNKQILSCM